MMLISYHSKQVVSVSCLSKSLRSKILLASKSNLLISHVCVTSLEQGMVNRFNVTLIGYRDGWLLLLCPDIRQVVSVS